MKAFVFPGQGSQYVGMGKDFYENFEEVRQLHEKVNERLGFNLTDIIFNNEEKLNLTEYTQPALVLTSYITYKIFKEKKGIEPDFVAGHSLGEFTALAVAGSLSLEDAVYITHIRGKLMQSAVPEGVGLMAAIIGLEASKIEEILKQIDGIVEIANYNSYEQTVISGEKVAVEKAMEILKSQGAKKVVPLVVSVPAHSSMLKEKAQEFGEYLEKIEIKDASIPVISNVSAKPITKAQDIKQELKVHFYSPVRWVQTIEYLSSMGVKDIYEIGPKKVLTGLIKRINKDLNLKNVETLQDIENA
ncbi:ACP S-malonyltransferase [Sulfurihydrogenibium azorense]|jgi:[acyl-carrier-protein] S-malonyltransferase|uniref:Malonyl CoA-acyl carrier protein transacylase n=1 Tax=Sulfurihydrogenibium azorense (strain DSM 15241 / OCM 825 / Az-Fu1) TaxID=204536 RepID=C1DWK0_SULAA|nr:ACP S-malonyltransferase [Sulfurihydrogenibium azorense]ACN98519.1 malonyl CoA-acyl carrier protein transacylase [Sulfurihydrogenibium azorense Az-Fu1]